MTLTFRSIGETLFYFYTVVVVVIIVVTMALVFTILSQSAVCVDWKSSKSSRENDKNTIKDNNCSRIIISTVLLPPPTETLLTLLVVRIDVRISTLDNIISFQLKIEQHLNWLDYSTLFRVSDILLRTVYALLWYLMDNKNYTKNCWMTNNVVQCGSLGGSLNGFCNFSFHDCLINLDSHSRQPASFLSSRVISFILFNRNKLFD